MNYTGLCEAGAQTLGDRAKAQFRLLLWDIVYAGEINFNGQAR